MDSILDRGIDYAIQHLEKRGEFFPFGLGMDSAGDISIVNAYTEEERPLSDPLIEKIVQVLAGAARKGEYTTTGVVSDVRLRDAASGESKDAIRIAIEDAESAPVTCYLPYSKQGDQIEPGSIFAEAGQSLVFDQTA
ncbi:hypothetical protein ABWH91_11085 [Phycisphaerales bacterium ac7]